jgi:hypothetical protein
LFTSYSIGTRRPPFHHWLTTKAPDKRTNAPSRLIPKIDIGCDQFPRRNAVVGNRIAALLCFQRCAGSGTSVFGIGQKPHCPLDAEPNASLCGGFAIVIEPGELAAAKSLLYHVDELYRIIVSLCHVMHRIQFQKCRCLVFQIPGASNEVVSWIPG